MKATILKIAFASVLISVVFIGKSFANTNTLQYDICVSNKNSAISNSYNDNRRKIRIGFTAPNTLHRQLLLTEDTNATSGIDWGYDGAYYVTEYDDMYWLIEGQMFTIQGTDIVDETSSFPLGFHTNTDGLSTIGIDGLENISEEFNIYLYDKELEVYHNLRESIYEFYADAGEYLDRFELVFTDSQQPSSSLSIKENEITNLEIYYSSTINALVLNNKSNTTLKGLSIYNTAGQLVYNYVLNESSTRQEIQFNNQLPTGIYIVLIETGHETFSQKMLIY
ncbi:T9SS type A sorting domain-containing protein [Winogradskyella luteola]|uniref:T9SS type A sorting domain-containing protein n=1 Tax=Winogradskyella luteola TaxID=2828330 RepID=A0A9X1F7F0_9FLAO|nr:T9SS type A sorting domain-containing protein [Winogradskyella luteola]MBV7268604.1 T9SS type A sorting domain-containing protein [Winogradskyella luteola]